MRDRLQPPAPDPDAPAPSTPIAYWRREFWRPAGYSDSVGLFADLGRRMLSRPLRLRWRLHVSARISAVAEAADEQAARAAVRAALNSYDTVVALSRAECDAVPPWRPLGIATSADIPGQVYGRAHGDGAWRCFTWMAASFTVDVADAAWPDCYFAIDIVTAPGTSRLGCLEVDGVHVAHRRPTWRQKSAHLRPDWNGAGLSPHLTASGRRLRNPGGVIAARRRLGGSTSLFQRRTTPPARPSIAGCIALAPPTRLSLPLGSDHICGSRPGA